MVAMLDSVEAKLKESLVKASNRERKGKEAKSQNVRVKAATPKVRRKAASSHNNLYHIGQIVSARNAMDSCWYSAKIGKFLFCFCFVF